MAGVVDALQAVDQGAALERDRSAGSIEPGVRRGQPRLERQLQQDLVTGLPGTLDTPPAVDRAGADGLAVHPQGRAVGRAGDAESQRPRRLGTVLDLHPDAAVPGVVGADRQPGLPPPTSAA